MYALQINNLTKTYENGVKALKGISLNVEQGDYFALLGPNGAGKSTTISITTSLVKKTAGQVSIFDVDIDENFSKAKQYVGVVPQEFNFSIFEKVEDIVTHQAGYYGLPRKLAKQRAEKYLKQLGLWEKRKHISMSLSGGMKRRLMIARALVHEPKMLILDEPTAGVDVELRRSMWEFLREINESGTTIILTTHYLEEAENQCRNIAIIDRGELIENTSLNELLHKLDSEDFILYLQDELKVLPEMEGFVFQLHDPYTLEAEMPKNSSMSKLFKVLDEYNIKVRSLRNKTSRLEALFMKLTQQEKR